MGQELRYASESDWLRFDIKQANIYRKFYRDLHRDTNISEIKQRYQAKEKEELDKLIQLQNKLISLNNKNKYRL